MYTISCHIGYRYPGYIVSSYHLVDSGCTEGDVRLAGGETVMEGRVEVCHNQTWWAVSGSSYWDFSDATVVCRHLHYPANCECYNQLLICMQVKFHPALDFICTGTHNFK